MSAPCPPLSIFHLDQQAPISMFFLSDACVSAKPLVGYFTFWLLLRCIHLTYTIYRVIRFRQCMGKWKPLLQHHGIFAETKSLEKLRGHYFYCFTYAISRWYSISRILLHSSCMRECSSILVDEYVSHLFKACGAVSASNNDDPIQSQLCLEFAYSDHLWPRQHDSAWHCCIFLETARYRDVRSLCCH